jgi:hypothetical protein
MAKQDPRKFPKGVRFAIQTDDDRWVVSYDPDGFDGRGHVVVSRLAKQAKTFASLKRAVNFFTQANRAGKQPFTTHSIALVRVR